MWMTELAMNTSTADSRIGSHNDGIGTIGTSLVDATSWASPVRGRACPRDRSRGDGPQSSTSLASLGALPAQDLPNGVDGVGLAGALVRPVALHAREPKRHPAGVARALLHVVERDLDHDLRPHVDDVPLLAHGELAERARLPLQH